MRAAIDRDYPNRDWLILQREVSLDRWFDRAGDTIRKSKDDEEARSAFDSLIARFNDGHVSLQWSEAAESGTLVTSARPAPALVQNVSSFCAARGYDASQVTAGTAAALPGFRSIDGGSVFAAGMVQVEGKSVGIVRIGVFSPQGYPSLCEQAVSATRTQVRLPCDDACDDRLLSEAYAIMTRGLITTVERLRSAGAEDLLVDLSHNGGGTEWAEAAARIVSPKPLRSAPLYVMRSQLWADRWVRLAARIRADADQAEPADRAPFLALAQQADATAEGLKPCTLSPCSSLAQAGYASGLVATALPATFLDKKWAPEVFNPSQFPYRESVWTGHLLVLVDSETWSAAEQFAALLQDNGSAVIIGTRTGGAGCGHLYGNKPVVLSNSKAQLELPNCLRLRKDGTNEVNGIVPDVSTGVRANDGPAFAGRLTASRMVQAIELANRQAQE